MIECLDFDKLISEKNIKSKIDVFLSGLALNLVNILSYFRVITKRVLLTHIYTHACVHLSTFGVRYFADSE